MNGTCNSVGISKVFMTSDAVFKVVINTKPIKRLASLHAEMKVLPCPSTFLLSLSAT